MGTMRDSVAESQRGNVCPGLSNGNKHRRVDSSAKDDPVFGVVDESTKPCEQDPSGRYLRYPLLLGRGACKRVFRAFDCEEGKEVAWNQVELHGVDMSESSKERLFDEIRVLQQLHHKNIMSFHDWWYNPKLRTVNFITEIFLSGTLRQYRKKLRFMNENILKRWAWQILEGLVYLHGHDPPIVHRDLKCDNIFVSGNTGQVKIGDLGLATCQQGLSVVGTPEFMAPEIYDEQYDQKVDIYSFGMCLLELSTLEYPYSECHGVAHIFRKVTQGIKPQALQRVMGEQLRALIEQCIAFNPQDRPEARKLLKHPFFESLRMEQYLPGSLLISGSRHPSSVNLSPIHGSTGARVSSSDPCMPRSLQLDRPYDRSAGESRFATEGGSSGGGCERTPSSSSRPQMTPEHTQQQQQQQQCMVSPEPPSTPFAIAGAPCAAISPGDLSPFVPSAQACICLDQAPLPAIKAPTQTQLLPGSEDPAGGPPATAAALLGRAANAEGRGGNAGQAEESTDKHCDTIAAAATAVNPSAAMPRLTGDPSICSLMRSLDHRERLNSSASGDGQERLHKSINISELAAQLHRHDGQGSRAMDDDDCRSESSDEVIIPIDCLARVMLETDEDGQSNAIRPTGGHESSELLDDDVFDSGMAPMPDVMNQPAVVCLSRATSLLRAPSLPRPMSSASIHSLKNSAASLSPQPSCSSLGRFAADTGHLEGLRPHSSSAGEAAVSAGGHALSSPFRTARLQTGESPLFCGSRRSFNSSLLKRSSVECPHNASSRSTPNKTGAPECFGARTSAHSTCSLLDTQSPPRNSWHNSSLGSVTTAAMADAQHATLPPIHPHPQRHAPAAPPEVDQGPSTNAASATSELTRPHRHSFVSRSYHLYTDSSTSLGLMDSDASGARTNGADLATGDMTRPIHGVIVRIKQCKGRGFTPNQRKDRLRRSKTM